MRRVDIVVAVVVLLVGGLMLWRFLTPKVTPTVEPTPAPTPSIEDQIEGIFDIDVPEFGEKVDLVPVGDKEGVAIATRYEKESRLLLSVLADLPATIQLYQVYGIESGKETNIGFLVNAKGGFMGEFDITGSSYSGVFVREGGEIILTGNFPQ